MKNESDNESNRRPVATTAAAFLSGLVFGMGLIVSRMADPEKVLDFLDLSGAWDPSLALVMAGAIAVGLFAFAAAKRRKTSLLGEPMQLPTNNRIDKRLVIGSLVFGAGWGLAGFCPGPALVALGAGEIGAVVFVVAMLAGMAVHQILQRRPPPVRTAGHGAR